MAAKAKVVLTDYVWESLDVEKKTLAGLADLVPLQTKKPDEFLPEAKDCDALLNTYAGPITAEVMAQMPRCKIIARYGIGVDTIDLDAATQAGIIVTNNPTYCIEEVAEHTMALLLAAARKIAFYDRMVRAGRWEVPPGKPMFRLAGSTLGLVGFGNIARQVAVRAAAFGMRVLFADPFIKEGQFSQPGSKMELKNGKGAAALDLAQPADKITVHIKDASGNVVRNLDLGSQPSGVAPVQWDGKNDAGAQLGDGSYQFSASALLGTEKSSVKTLSYGLVNGVKQKPDGASLTVEQLGDVSLDSVKQIL